MHECMGGGSEAYTSVPSKTIEEAEKLFKVATQAVKEEIKQEERPIRNVFISFHTEDESAVNLLRSQAKREAFGLEFRDYSVKEPFDEKWKQQVRERIALTSATIVMIGPDTADRPAVNFEIEASYNQARKVIGVKIYKDRDYPIPAQMMEKGAPVVNWSMDEIQRELDKE